MCTALNEHNQFLLFIHRRARMYTVSNSFYFAYSHLHTHTLNTFITEILKQQIISLSIVLSISRALVLRFHGRYFQNLDEITEEITITPLFQKSVSVCRTLLLHVP